MIDRIIDWCAGNRFVVQAIRASNNEVEGRPRPVMLNGPASTGDGFRLVIARDSPGAGFRTAPGKLHAASQPRRNRERRHRTEKRGGRQRAPVDMKLPVIAIERGLPPRVQRAVFERECGRIQCDQ